MVSEEHTELTIGLTPRQIVAEVAPGRIAHHAAIKLRSILQFGVWQILIPKEDIVGGEA